MSRSGSEREHLWGVAALLFLTLATVGWWALALWPVPEGTPEWLERARWVCFDAAPGGLPGPSGWILLIGQPIGLLAVLMLGWGRAVRAGLGWLAGPLWGRALLATCVGALGLGLAASAIRVSNDSGGQVVLPGELPPVGAYPRLDREAPALGLVDQNGERFDLDRLAGRSALVTFAFGHCETVCPAIVRETLEVQERSRAKATAGSLPIEQVPQVVVVTLDPWRDTPARLPHLVQHWETGEDAFLLSGEVDAVNRVLDGWNVARERDTRTGSVAHPPLVYVLDTSGRIAYATTGGVDTLLALVSQLESG